jgi:hypothetical protein
MTQLNNPSMSYAELTLPLPCSKELWFAKTAEEFKARYLESAAGDGKRPPSLGDLFRDLNALSANAHRLDVQFSTSIYLHGFWSLVWEYRQLASIHSTTSSNMNLLLTSRREDLQTQLKAFRLLTDSNGQQILSAQESLLFHFLLLNLRKSNRREFPAGFYAP